MNRLLLSFLVAGTALGGSAFQNVESHSTVERGKTLAPGYFVQSGTNSYTYVSTTTHDQGQCLASNPSSCAYRVPINNSIPADQPSFTKEQLVQEYGLNPANSQVGIWTSESEN